jgi:hypothetical protein
VLLDMDLAEIKHPHLLLVINEIIYEISAWIIINSYSVFFGLCSIQ